jgi:hypothetical protein
MKEYGSISWIGEEGISSKDHTYEGKERIKPYAGGFQQKKAIGKSQTIRILSYKILVHINRS